MVDGIKSFAEAFKGYEDCYTVIGGTACDLLMGEMNLTFRATKDIDMIVLVENNIEEFSKVFWEYIKKAKYICGWKNSDKVHFYRFTSPISSKYPSMIELFSKNLQYDLQNEDSVLTPIHVSDEISSLSAIMLNTDYYNFMLKGKRIIAGISVLGVKYVIPFKMRAWVDLVNRKNNGEFVKSTDIKKHKHDVFRLIQIIENEEEIETSSEMKDDISKFINGMIEENLDLRNIGLEFNLIEAIELLQKIYLSKS